MGSDTRMKTDGNTNLYKRVKIDGNTSSDKRVKTDGNTSSDERVKIDESMRSDTRVKVDGNMNSDTRVKIDESMSSDKNMKIGGNVTADREEESDMTMKIKTSEFVNSGNTENAVEAKRKLAWKAIDERAEEFCAVSDAIWENPETSFQEFTSAGILCDFLENEGFQVEKGLAGIPTAFSGKFGSGSPVVAILGEFDALYGMSQESGGFEQKAVLEGHPGHGCGHNLLGAGALAAAVGVKRYLEETKTPGTVIYYGCPGEEGGSGKTFMVREGVFDGVDCAFTWHPNTVNIIPPCSTLANYQIRYRFHGRSAHAAGAPHMGRSALDALELMNTGVQYLREHVKSDVRIHYAVTNTGSLSPNVVQAEAEALYLLRAPKIGDLKEIYRRVNLVAQGAAMMTETTVEILFDKACSNILPNDTLAKVMQKNMESIGCPGVTEEEKAYLTRINNTIPEKRNLIAEVAESLGEKGRALAAAARGGDYNDFLVPYLPVSFVLSSSTDVGDVSFTCPLAQAATATVSAGTPAHSWQTVSQGKSSVAHKNMLFAGKIIAGSVIDVLEQPEIAAKARQEWRERLKEQPYECPIPKEIQPKAGPALEE